MTIIRAELLSALKKAKAFAPLANSTFSGQINQKNDKVKLIQVGNINIGDYVDGTDITNQALTDAALEIIADQDKYYAFTLDTLEFNNAKSGILNEAGINAADAVQDAVESYFAALYADALLTDSTYNDSSPLDMTSLNIDDAFLDMAERFGVANVPRGIRKVAIVPAWVSSKLLLHGITAKTDNTAAYASGYIGTAFGFDFVESNNVSMGTASTGAQTRIMCVVPNQSLGYASAVTAMEASQVEKQIGKTLVKGRFVFGGKVVRPDMTGVIYADKTAEE